MTTEKLKSLLKNSLIGIVVSGLLILSNYAQVLTPVQNLFDQALVPIQVAISTTDTKIKRFFSGIGSIGSSKYEARILREEVVRLQSENSELAELKAENEYLRTQINAKDRVKMEYLVAEVVSFDRDVVGVGRLKLNVGSSDDVEIGRIVVASRGVLLGRVVSVQKYTCMIEMVTDPTDKIPVKIENKNIRGLFIGQSGDSFLVENISREASISAGKRVITSGEDGNYPTGLLMGVVKEETVEPTSAFKTLILEPLFDLSELHYVLVEAQ